MSPWRQH